MTKGRAAALACMASTFALWAGAGAARADVAIGRYECWYFTRPQPGLNFAITGAGHYTDVEGKPGTYTLQPSSGQITFRGGALDGQRPIYRAGPPPKVSFMSPRGAEAAFCELAGR